MNYKSVMTVVFLTVNKLFFKLGPQSEVIMQEFENLFLSSAL